MSGLDGSKGYVRLAATSAALLFAPSFLAAEPDVSAAFRQRLASNVRISDPYRAVAVRKALFGAFEKLGQAKCQRIFTDFRDASGQTLQEKLDALGETGRSYLQLVFFYEGSERPF